MGLLDSLQENICVTLACCSWLDTHKLTFISSDS